MERTFISKQCSKYIIIFTKATYMNIRNKEIDMKNFMIGQYGKYDSDKFNRDYRKGFYGTEACLLNSEEDIDKLVAESRKNGFNIGIHFPLRAGVHKLRDPQFLSNVDSVREDSFRCIE